MKMIMFNIAELAKESDRLQLALQKAEDVRDEAARAVAVLRAAAQNKLGLDDIIEDSPATKAVFNNPMSIEEDADGESEEGEARRGIKPLRHYKSVFSDGPTNVNPME